MSGLPASCSSFSRTAWLNDSRSSCSRTSSRTCLPKRCSITLRGTLPGRKPFRRVVRAISPRRWSTCCFNRSAGRLKVMRRSWSPSDSTVACISTPAAAAAAAARIVLSGMDWLARRRTPRGHRTRAGGCCPAPGERHSLAQSGHRRQRHGGGGSARTRARMIDTGTAGAQNYRPFAALARHGSPDRGIAQPGSASGLGPEGRGFESLCPDHPADAVPGARSSTG